MKEGWIDELIMYKELQGKRGRPFHSFILKGFIFHYLYGPHIQCHINIETNVLIASLNTCSLMVLLIAENISGGICGRTQRLDRRSCPGRADTGLPERVSQRTRTAQHKYHGNNSITLQYHYKYHGNNS